jgi:hypothetical protein
MKIFLMEINRLREAFKRALSLQKNEEGKFNTQVLNEETGEILGCLEWHESSKRQFDIEGTIKLLKEMGLEIEKEVFYKVELKTLKELEETLKRLGLSKEVMERCFIKIKNDIELKIKKL